MSLTLRGARLLSSKSQRQMADLLGIHVQTYRRLEKSPDLVTIAQAKKISEIFGVSCNEIFFGK